MKDTDRDSDLQVQTETDFVFLLYFAAKHLYELPKQYIIFILLYIYFLYIVNCLLCISYRVFLLYLRPTVHFCTCIFVLFYQSSVLAMTSK